MSDSSRDAALLRLRAVLEQARRENRTVTYLQAADATGIEPPQRIHQLARLVEILLKQDVAAGRVPLAALVVSRVRGGLPAPGFFDRAARLGIFDGADPARFHSELLASLFNSTGKFR
ncbi:MAG TPA: hypothetical protein VJ908_12290 [Wenzhouxiangellaceae bacterium]|nr:hypothetical protein [Wenzhouxiangellaceae bacterium]